MTTDARDHKLGNIDHDEILQRLPLALAVAMRLHEAGADPALIATALGIEPEGVGPLLSVARAKADRIERDAGAGRG
jgi:hypothetical protein